MFIWRSSRNSKTNEPGNFQRSLFVLFLNFRRYRWRLPPPQTPRRRRVSHTGRRNRVFLHKNHATALARLEKPGLFKFSLRFPSYLNTSWRRHKSQGPKQNFYRPINKQAFRSRRCFLNSAQKRIQVSHRSRHPPKILDSCSISQIHRWNKSKILRWLARAVESRDPNVWTRSLKSQISNLKSQID